MKAKIICVILAIAGGIVTYLSVFHNTFGGVSGFTDVYKRQERNRRWRPKFIADQLLNVEIVDPLVFPGVAAVGYPLGDCPQGVAEIRIKIAGK